MPFPTVPLEVMRHAVPPDVYAFAKRRLHAPALERVRAARAWDDPEVLKMWSSERTRSVLRDYLGSLRRA
ncbi:hypothetical protein [Nonomuraea sp. GTA35]|uniref:hypothetical protein n=1 Tax=Nonomuraea sp. GTA35 TaxID=1676746 RepID=UPI0035C0F2A5